MAKYLLTATFTIEYDIETDVDGKQMPLLFYAMNYDANFDVWVDGKWIEATNLPDNYYDAFALRLANFSGNHLYELDIVHWDGDNSATYKYQDLKYFETSLTKGFHKIRVQYVALRSSWRSSFVMPSSFSYSLAPAKYWRSFGTLQIILNTHNYPATRTTSLDHYKHLSTDSLMVWDFKALPADVFQIDCEPKVSWLAWVLLKLNPFGLTIILALCLLGAHIRQIVNYRKEEPDEKLPSSIRSWDAFIPIVLFFFFLFSFGLINMVIGANAGNELNGYVVMFAIIVTVIFAGIYLNVMLLVDAIVKQMLKTKAG